MKISNTGSNIYVPIILPVTRNSSALHLETSPVGHEPNQTMN